jgi:hypothetical protein
MFTSPILLSLLGGFARHALTVAGTALVAKGVISADGVAAIMSAGTTIVGSLAVIIPTIWSAIKNYKQATK